MTTRFPLRPFLLADTERLQDLFAQSIEELTQDDYDEEQRLAWIERAADAEAFAERLQSNTTILVDDGEEILGFASLKNNAEIDFLYVHPFAIAQGVGSALLEAVEKLARARGANSLAADVSDTAHDFFSSRGYVPMRRNEMPVGDVWLANTTMTKDLTADGQTKSGKPS